MGAVLEAVQGLAALRQRVPEGGIDALVVDAATHPQQGLSILDACLALGVDLPVLVLAGDDRMAVEAVARGAHEALVTQPLRPDAAARALASAAARQQARARRSSRVRVLEQAIAGLSARNQELDDFAHRLAHDLKAPLRAAVLRLDHVRQSLAAGGAAMGSDAIQEFDAATARLQRLLQTIDETLRFAVAGLPEHPVEVDLRAVVDDTLRMVDPPASARVLVDVDVPAFLARRTRLQSVLQNLLANAIQHGASTSLEVAVTARAMAGLVHAAVQDNGAGVPEAQRPRLFQMGAPGDPLHGSGIGLALARRLVEAEGGSMRYDTATRGSGAVFSFTWPMRPGQGSDALAGPLP